MQKGDKLRWWIAIFLNDLPLGTKFQPGQLHLTLIPWFTTDIDDAQVGRAFTDEFQNFPRFELRLSENVMFGPHNDVEVTLVEPTSELLQLHVSSLELFEQLGSHWAVKNPYVAAEYKPHIRQRAGSSIKPGQTIEVSSLSLVKTRRQEDNQREIAEEVRLV
jgi:2'-5' RNA ligase